MAKPTFADILPGVEVVEDVADIAATVSPTSPGVFIPWTLFSAQGVDNLESLDNPEAVLTAIIMAAKNFYRTDTTEQPNIEYDEPRPTIISRNNENKLAYQYGITFYQDFAMPNLDPDLVASS